MGYGHQDRALGYQICARNWIDIPIESDCQNAVNLIHEEENEENHPERILVEDCRALIWEMNTTVIHIYKEANRCACLLAKLGGAQAKQAVRMLVPPEDLIEYLKADMQGAGLTFFLI